MKNKVFPVLILSGFSFFQFSCCTNKGSETSSRPEAIAPVNSQPTAPVLWKELPVERFSGNDSLKRNLKKYKLVALDSLMMQSLLAKSPDEKQRKETSLKSIIELPLPDGGYMKFSIYKTTVMDSALEARYPLLKTYGGQGIEDPTASVRLDFNPNGFHAYVMSQAGEWFVQPAAHGITHQYLVSFFKRDAIVHDRKPFELPDPPQK